MAMKAATKATTRTASKTGTLTVNGEGRIQIKPDIARIRLSVITAGRTAEAALAENSKRAQSVIDRMRSLGISGRGLTTLGINVSPIIVYGEGPEKGRITGYRAENTVMVEADVELAGRVLDEGIAAGANQSSGLSFEVRDDTNARAQALKAASRAAHADAETVAQAMGIKLRGPASIDILEQSRPVFLRTDALTRQEAPVEAGELTVSARVRVTFEYR